MASHILIRNPTPGVTLFPLPDHVSAEEAALAEPLSVALHAIDLVKVKPGEKVAILGAGPIGLCAVAMLRHRGVKDIAIFDMEDERLERARALGANTAVNVGRQGMGDALVEAHGGGDRFGARYAETDAFIDAAGAPAALKEVIGVAKYRARIAVVALYKKPTDVDLFKVMANEITIVGSIAVDRAREFGEALEMIAGGEIDLSPMISHRFEFQRFHDALAVAADSKHSAKVMLTFP
jgi:threonine dehydrogenase-like Zn-dependent dehydrogenase